MKQKITSITAQKRPGRFNVFLDGNYAFSVSEEVLVKFQLSKGKELDSADLEEIFEEIGNVALIFNNTIYKSGKKEEILTNENLSEIFDTKLSIGEKNGRYFVEEIF